MAKKEISTIEDLTYEQAYEELEQIVTSLESSQSTLEESIKMYERGQQLADHCAKLLESAELKVRKLTAASVEESE